MSITSQTFPVYSKIQPDSKSALICLASEATFGIIDLRNAEKYSSCYIDIVSHNHSNAHYSTIK